MKSKILVVLLAVCALLLVGCKSDNSAVVYPKDEYEKIAYVDIIEADITRRYWGVEKVKYEGDRVKIYLYREEEFYYEYYRDARGWRDYDTSDKSGVDKSFREGYGKPIIIADSKNVVVYYKGEANEN